MADCTAASNCGAVCASTAPSRRMTAKPSSRSVRTENGLGTGKTLLFTRHWRTPKTIQPHDRRIKPRRRPPSLHLEHDEGHVVVLRARAGPLLAHLGEARDDL